MLQGSGVRCTRGFPSIRTTHAGVDRMICEEMPRSIFRSIDHLAGAEVRSVSVRQLAQVSARWKIRLLRVCSVSSLAFHVSTNSLSVDASICRSVRNKIQIAILSLSLCPCSCGFLSPCHCIHVHWCSSTLLLSPLSAHCQKRLNGCAPSLIA